MRPAVDGGAAAAADADVDGDVRDDDVHVVDGGRRCRYLVPFGVVKR